MCVSRAKTLNKHTHVRRTRPHVALKPVAAGMLNKPNECECVRVCACVCQYPVALYPGGAINTTSDTRGGKKMRERERRRKATGEEDEVEAN